MNVRKGTPPVISEAQIMTKAAVIAADRLGLDTATFATTIGVSETRIVEMTRLEDLLRKGTPPFERALLLIRLFRTLKHAGDEITARKWLHEQNDAMGCRPIEMVTEPDNLGKLIRHLEDEAMAREPGCMDGVQ
ncbi:transcriptional regulator, XRE family protein [Neorhizobium sp. JUb45]|uniref:transcriptional regulator, XRE family protein n=1 Tax=unclassified Neorhizobium TaxID=2629175 RepID=UPI0010E590F4|nr:transcriptional regulator, XRE family protein [Neorhizobium sp. JUb45]TCR02951.1 hypothetical protein EDF70_103377 [Neorhizobium sp. JUb45]